MQLFNEPPIEGRKCGSCTVCCTVMAIKEINKPNYVKCGCVIDGKGCNIYSEKPKACNDFKCMWLSGHYGREEDRPDKIGVMFSVSEIQMGSYCYTVVAWIVGTMTEKIKYLLTRMSKKRVIAIRDSERFSLLGRRKEVEEVERTISCEVREEPL